MLHDTCPDTCRCNTTSQGWADLTGFSPGLLGDEVGHAMTANQGPTTVTGRTTMRANFRVSLFSLQTSLLTLLSLCRQMGQTEDGAGGVRHRATLDTARDVPGSSVGWSRGLFPTVTQTTQVSAASRKDCWHGGIPSCPFPRPPSAGGCTKHSAE